LKRGSALAPIHTALLSPTHRQEFSQRIACSKVVLEAVAGHSPQVPVLDGEVFGAARLCHVPLRQRQPLFDVQAVARVYQRPCEPEHSAMNMHASMHASSVSLWLDEQCPSQLAAPHLRVQAFAVRPP
jgi:hypothetical protein